MIHIDADTVGTTDIIIMCNYVGRDHECNKHYYCFFDSKMSDTLNLVNINSIEMTSGNKYTDVVDFEYDEDGNIIMTDSMKTQIANAQTTGAALNAMKIASSNLLVESIRFSANSSIYLLSACNKSDPSQYETTYSSIATEANLSQLRDMSLTSKNNMRPYIAKLNKLFGMDVVVAGQDPNTLVSTTYSTVYTVFESSLVCKFTGCNDVGLSKIVVTSELQTADLTTYEVTLILPGWTTDNSVSSITIVGNIHMDALAMASPQITEVILPGSYTHDLPERCFRGSSITTIVIPNGVPSLGSECFSECALLTSVYCSNAIYQAYHEDSNMFSNLANITFYNIANGLPFDP